MIGLCSRKAIHLVAQIKTCVSGAADGAENILRGTAAICVTKQTEHNINRTHKK